VDGGSGRQYRGIVEDEVSDVILKTQALLRLERPAFCHVQLLWTATAPKQSSIAKYVRERTGHREAAVTDSGRLDM